MTNTATEADASGRAPSAFGVTFVRAALLGIVATLLMKVTVVRGLRHSLPEDLGDPVLVSWILAWGAHGLRTQPLQIWDANAFWPLRPSLAFTDALLGLAPLGVAFGNGFDAAVLRYNVMFLLAYALAFAGAYALARQLGTGPVGAAVAGAGYAFAPWHLAQEGHLHVLFNGGIPLSLALLARGHGFGGGGDRVMRPGAALAGWLVAAWQVSIGWGMGLPFAYILGVIGVLVLGAWLLQRRRHGRPPALSRRFIALEAAGIVCFVAVAIGFAVPYLVVAAEYPDAVRTVGHIEVYSPPLHGFVTAPSDSHVWGERQQGLRAELPYAPEMTLSPGVMLLALAAVGVAAGRWSWRRRVALLAGCSALLALALGTRFPGGGRFTYLVLFEHLPGWQSIRTPGRLVVFLTLGVALLAAAGADRISGAPSPQRREGARTRVWVARQAMAVALGVLVLLEGWGTTPSVQPLPVPAALDHAEGPVLVLPADGFVEDSLAMLHSTEGFYPLVNGSSGFNPPLTTRIREQVATFPDQQSVQALRDLGVRTVVLFPDRAVGSPWQDAASAPLDGLGITLQLTGDALVYRL